MLILAPVTARRVVCYSWLAVLVALSDAPAHAQVWTNTTGGSNSGNISDGTNWIGGVAPTSSAATDLTFGATTGTNLINFDAGLGVDPFVLNSILLNRGTTQAGNVALVFDGPTALRFEGSGANITTAGTGVAGNANMQYTFNNDLIIGGNNLLMNASGTMRNGIVVQGNITASSGGATTLTLGGISTTAGSAINGVIGQDGSTVLSLIKTDAGNWTLANTNAFTGNVSVLNGTLIVRTLANAGQADSLGIGNTVTLGDAANTGNLQLANPTATAPMISDRTINLNGTTGGGTITQNNTNATASLLITGNVVAAGAGAKLFSLSGSNTGLNEISSKITNNGPNLMRLQKAGTGLWIVSNTTNDFTGGTSITQGTLRVASLTNNLNVKAGGGSFLFSASTGTVAILETAGTGANGITNALGTSAGQISWGTNLSGGFGAFGGALDVNLNSGAALTWGSGSFVNGTGELQFGNVLSNNVVTLQNAVNLNGGARVIRVTDNTSTNNDITVLSGNLSGGASGGITKVGNGYLALTGNNTFTGGITISGGTVRGALSSLVLNQAAANNNNIKFNAIGNTVGGAVLESSGTLTNNLGTGLNQVHWGMVTGTITQGASGGFSAYGGTLHVRLNNDASTPLVWGSTANFLALTATNELQFGSQQSNNVITFENAVNLNNAARVVRVYDNPDVSTDYAVMSGVISGGGAAGALTKQGPGTLVLTGANTYTGVTNIAAGTLQIGDGGTTGILSSSVVANSGVLVFDRSDTVTFDGVISGSGSLSKLESNTLILTGNSTFTGVTTVGGGTLVLKGHFASPIELGGNVLQFDATDTQTIGGIIAGNGTLQKLGSGTTALTAMNTFSGTTSIDAGTLLVDHALGGTVYVNTGGSFLGSGANGGTIIVNGGSGSVSGTQSGTTSVSSGTINVNNGGRLAGVVNVEGGQLNVNSGAAVIGDLTQVSGIVNVNSGASTSGAITVSGGSFFINAGGTVSSTAGINVGSGATFNVAGGGISGNGAITVGGHFVANGLVGEGTVNLVIETGGTLSGSGSVLGTVVVETGGNLSPGNSIESLDLGGLTLSHGSSLHFEFNDAPGMHDFGGGNTGPGYSWDLIDLNAGILDLGDAAAGSQIDLYINAVKLLNSSQHATAPGDLIFNPLSSYEWLFIQVDDLDKLTTNGNADDFNRRFHIIEEMNGAGVFDITVNNPFERPMSSEGQGTFSVAWRDGSQGMGLYIQYSAIPEPGSLILASLTAGSLGWYRRRRKKQRLVQPIARIV